MDKTTLMLFGKMPRELSLSRWIAENLDDMKKYIQYNNGVNDIYASVYPSNFIIDKIFFDLDYGKDVLGDAKRMYSWMKEQGYSVIPIVSGKKGYHLYLMLRAKIYGPQAKILLTRATFSIIKSVFGDFRQELYIQKNGKQVQVLRTKDRIIGVDPMPCGDINRIGRIPNTLRPPENHNYCTYLPPDEFLDMTESDVAKHMKSPHHYSYNIDSNGAPLLTDFEYDFDEVYFEKWESFSKNAVVATSNPNSFLKDLLRPCLYNRVTSIHPDHWSRAYATIDLLNENYSPEEILSIYETLGWEDFNEKKTMQQIKSCVGYESVSCTKLRKKSIPVYGCCVG